MEVKDANSALLSNYEVFQLLTDLKEQRKESGKNKHSSGQQNLNTITYEVSLCYWRGYPTTTETLKYISKTPCRHQTPEIVREFLTAMKSHKLTKAEKLQLLNHRPMTAVEIQLCSSRGCPLIIPASGWPLQSTFCTAVRVHFLRPQT
ncbi:DNA-directed RNA polymerase III subunit RPC9 isoform X6 [Vulpes lagopus]|uniref:DNA-directed RNA polymerase III subunit RPC9 isoform X6 n=1 Tax=Vulpes lagopus TaxID=494514 RepID=UPI001BC90954|nr:DNA-directed RNA polymerase III subunit RPC9 isoform X6 [Vulpes lagopus]